MPVSVEFDASASYDPDGDPITFAWDFDGDGVYGEDPDDNYTGTPDKPTHVYTASYAGEVHVKVTDPSEEEDVCTVNVDVTVKTTCGTMNMPSGANTYHVGTNRLYFYNPQGTRVSNPAYVLGAYSSGIYLSAVLASGGTAAYFTTTNPYTIQNTALTSTDKLIYQDTGSYQSLWTAQFDPVNGYTNIRTSWGPPVPSGNIWRLDIDENDNPIALVYTSATNCIIYHWNGTSWGTGITVPSALMTAAGSYSYINDMEYDPTTGFYLLAERNGVPGIWAVDKNGTVVWKDEDIWSGLASGYQIGIEVPKDNGEWECRILVMAGWNAASQTIYWARYNPMGGEKQTSTTYQGTFGLFDGRGTLVKVGTQWRFCAATYGGNVWGFQNIPF